MPGVAHRRHRGGGLGEQALERERIRADRELMLTTQPLDATRDVSTTARGFGVASMASESGGEHGG